MHKIKTSATVFYVNWLCSQLSAQFDIQVFVYYTTHSSWPSMVRIDSNNNETTANSNSNRYQFCMRWMRFSLNLYYCLLAINTCPNNKTVSHSTCSTNAAESSSIKPAEWRQSNIKIGLDECRVKLETHRKTWQKTAIKTINFVSVYYISSAAINSALCFSLLWKACYYLCTGCLAGCCCWNIHRHTHDMPLWPVFFLCSFLVGMLWQSSKSTAKSNTWNKREKMRTWKTKKKQHEAQHQVSKQSRECCKSATLLPIKLKLCFYLASKEWNRSQ